MNAYLDAWNLMAYDYAGSWSNYSGHDANLYPSTSSPNATPFSTTQAIGDYVAAGVPASAISLGFPLYGRSFEATAGIGMFTMELVVGAGRTAYGITKFCLRLVRCCSLTLQLQLLTVMILQPKSCYHIDTPAEAALKATYIKNNGLGGAMCWEASGDKTASESLITTVFNSLGGLEQSQNLLSYPASQYANTEAGMPGVQEDVQ